MKQKPVFLSVQVVRMKLLKVNWAFAFQMSDRSLWKSFFFFCKVNSFFNFLRQSINVPTLMSSAQGFVEVSISYCGIKLKSFVEKCNRRNIFINFE